MTFIPYSDGDLPAEPHWTFAESVQVMCDTCGESWTYGAEGMPGGFTHEHSRLTAHVSPAPLPPPPRT